MKSLLLFVFLSFILAEVNAQNYPQDQFINPTNIEIKLAGNFGECRPNHFHTGIDIKTNNLENLPIKASASGYISRISISATGYGNCLYMTHPNGFTTVYAHLNDFSPIIMKRLYEEQVKQKLWNVDFNLNEGELNFTQGQEIAKSGNTGGSTAPHLHFEIRDTKSGYALNPLLFGFKVNDHKAPIAKNLGIYDALNTINNQVPIKINLSKVGAVYKKAETIKIPFEKIYIGVETLDFTDDSQNWIGVFAFKLEVNGVQYAEVLLDQINLKENRAINAYADSRNHKIANIWYQGFYKLKNNNLNIYKQLSNNGIIDIKSLGNALIKITLKDVYGNEAVVEQSIQYTETSQVIKNNSNIIAGTYQDYNVDNNYFNIKFNDKSLYDNTLIQTQISTNNKYFSKVYSITNPYIPIHSSIEVAIKTNKLIPFNLRSKLVIMNPVKASNLPGQASQNGVAAIYEYGYAKATFKQLGTYYVQIDSLPPSLTWLSKSKEIKAKINDNLTSVATINAYLNNNWVPMSKVKDIYTYRLPNNLAKGKYEFKIEVRDESNNSKIYTTTLIN